ncbi:HNH/endonuclease VII fold toxin-2 domain-containing protein [Massilia rubra]|uniref:Tox-GHH2 domain-containing protein n=1 Tax=Massilia rubra TaxID=2607910 RepID=A0ABX0LUE6_9BURK|nr:HNH/endonuclease VII fold toxin-2 domain-containing protein [Massilia rubra]NHZ38473.1 hypothetical protein [Massilia rubra]
MVAKIPRKRKSNDENPKVENPQSPAKNQNSPAAAQPAASALKTGGNTISSPYLDTFNTKKACKKDLADVVQNCTPHNDEKDAKTGKAKLKPQGIKQKLSKVTDVIDTLGKKLTGYTRNIDSKTAFDGNGWMEEGCTGAWVTPFAPRQKGDQAGIDADKKKLAEVKTSMQDMLKKLENEKMSLLMSSLSSLKAMALAAAKAKAEEIIQRLAVKIVVKAFFGVVLVETVAGPFIMAAWTAHDIVATAAELAALIGPKGEAVSRAMAKILNIKDEAKKILAMYDANPHRAQADAMSLLAQLNPCMRARKCLLIPYKNTTPDGVNVPEVEKNKATAQARHGTGCCPGQTGHHIIPNAMMEGVGCAAYEYENAPTICLEGTKNGFEHGSHGLAHKNLSESIKEYKKKNNSNFLDYKEAKKQGIDAVVEAGAFHCNRECLEAQIDSHYKPCEDKMLNANAGTGKAVKKSQPAVSPTIPSESK